MKKYIFSFIILLLFNCISTQTTKEISQRDPFVFGEITAAIENYFNQKSTPTQVSFRYNQKKDESEKIREKIEIYFNDYIYRTCITMEGNSRKKMFDLIKKYETLMEKSRKDESKEEKEIGSINVDISWDIGENNWIDTLNSKMFFLLHFAGKDAYNLKIYFSEAKNEVKKHKPGTLYFNNNGVKELLTILSDTSYNKYF